jgi:hypothetical protein
VNLEHSIPQPRELPPGRLAQRAEHLRAELGQHERRTYALTAAAALAILAVILATPAFGLQGHIVNLFTADHRQRPPELIQRFFRNLPLLEPGETRKPHWVVADKARVAVALRIPGHGTKRLWVAPTRNGGFCAGTPDGCDRYRRRPFFTTMQASPPTDRNGHIFFEGDTLAHGARIVVRFEDGSSERIPLVWVSRPIDAGFFVYDLPKAHWKIGKRPVVLTVEDAHGKQLARSTKAAGYLREMQAEGFAPSSAAETSHTLLWIVLAAAVVLLAAALGAAFLRFGRGGRA